MKERPIIFNGAMVRALLAGTKTQTRRVVNLRNGQSETGGPCAGCGAVVDSRHRVGGSRLWVRETWKHHDWTEDGEPIIGYAAGGTWLPCMAPDLTDRWAKLSEPDNFAVHGRACDQRWRRSNHMPRWASRITLEITGVRVERLQDISIEDAYAEGAADWAAETVRNGNKYPSAIAAFRALWESINGYGSWGANPWVWVIEFQRKD